MTILELKAERARVFEQMKALAQMAKDESREMNQEEQDTWDRMNDEVDSLAAQVSHAEKEERLSALRASLDERAPKRAYGPRSLAEIFLDEARALMAGESRYVEFKFSADEKRTALQAAATPGSHGVPGDFVGTLREYLIDFSGIRQTNVTVVTTESGDDIRIPRATSHPTATLIGETSQIMGAGEKSILFGDFSGYYIRDVGSIRIERSNDFKFDTDVVTFRTIMRTDGDLIDANCVKAYQNSAT